MIKGVCANQTFSWSNVDYVIHWPCHRHWDVKYSLDINCIYVYYDGGKWYIHNQE